MIKLNNVAIGYNSLVIRDNLSYTFEEDKIYGILGESGVGKTTFLKTIAGLLKPLSGTLEVGNKKNIYMMHQAYTCFDWLTCLDNILITERIKYIEKIVKDIEEEKEWKRAEEEEHYNLWKLCEACWKKKNCPMAPRYECGAFSPK